MFTRDICKGEVYSVELLSTSSKKPYNFYTKINGNPVGTSRVDINFNAMESQATVRLTAAMQSKDGTPNIKSLRTLTLKFSQFSTQGSGLIFANDGKPTIAKVSKAK